MNSGYVTILLGEVCPVVTRKPKPFTGIRNYYSTGAVSSEGEYSTPETVDFANRPSRAGCMPEIGDIGFARMKGTKKVIFIDEGLRGSLFSTGFCFIEPSRQVLQRFAYYFISSDEFQDAKNRASGDGIMGGIKNSDAESIAMPLPPLPEQQRIVALLDEAFAGLATAQAHAERNLRNARALFESHLNAVFSQRGDGWVERRLEEIGKTQTGSTPKTSENSNYGDFISFVKPADFNPDGSLDYDKDGLSKSGAENARIVPAGSVLMVCIGATIGKCGYSSQDVTTNQQINSLTPADGSSHRFLYYQMLTESFQQSVIHRSGQATLPIINKSKWSALSVWLPQSIAEQKRIAAKFDALSAETRRLSRLYEQKLAALAALKQSLLHQAFSGAL